MKKFIYIFFAIIILLCVFFSFQRDFIEECNCLKYGITEEVLSEKFGPAFKNDRSDIYLKNYYKSNILAAGPIFGLIDFKTKKVLQLRCSEDENPSWHINKKDVNKICQTLIDYPKLQWVFHPEIQNRVPVKFSNNIVGSEIELVKYDYPVKIISENKLDIETPYFKISDLIIYSDSAFVKFSYKAEGVSGGATLVKNKQKKWGIINVYFHEN